MKSQLVPVTITGANANSSGLAFSRLAVGAPAAWPVAGLGVDAGGNVVVTDAGFRNVSLSDVVNASNSAADTTVVTSSFSANSLSAGSSGRIRLYGVVNSVISSTFNIWVKVGTTKVVTVSYYSGLLAAFGNAPVTFSAFFTLRSSGSQGQMIWGYDSVCPQAATSPVIGSNLATINTTLTQTISVGFNWSNAATANALTVNQAIISPV